MVQSMASRPDPSFLFQLLANASRETAKDSPLPGPLPHGGPRWSSGAPGLGYGIWGMSQQVGELSLSPSSKSINQPKKKRKKRKEKKRKKQGFCKGSAAFPRDPEVRAPRDPSPAAATLLTVVPPAWALRENGHIPGHLGLIPTSPPFSVSADSYTWR